MLFRRSCNWHRHSQRHQPTISCARYILILAWSPFEECHLFSPCSQINVFIFGTETTIGYCYPTNGKSRSWRGSVRDEITGIRKWLHSCWSDGCVLRNRANYTRASDYPESSHACDERDSCQEIQYGQDLLYVKILADVGWMNLLYFKSLIETDGCPRITEDCYIRKKKFLSMMSTSTSAENSSRNWKAVVINEPLLLSCSYLKRIINVSRDSWVWLGAYRTSLNFWSEHCSEGH